MLQNFFGFLIIGAVAIFFLRIGLRRVEEKDYSQYPTTEALVLHTEDDHWIVEFVDKNGEEVLGRDDERTIGSFNPPDIRVKKGAKELVYYWPWSWPNVRYRISGKQIKYHIHFCNPEYNKKEYKTWNLSTIIGVVLAVAAVITLFFGNGTA